MDIDRVWTMGYQGRLIEDFVRVLSDAGITTVVDVRRHPVSRRPGFSKSSFASALAASGIDYVHVRDLGMPSEWLPLRNERDGNREILALYRNSMGDRNRAVRNLSELASRERICLVCFEADYHHCHRSVIAESLKARQFQILHLG